MKQFFRALAPAALRGRLAGWRWLRKHLAAEFAVNRRHFGPRAARRILANDLRHRAIPPTGRPLSSVRLPGYAHPVYYRHGGSDLDVMRQVLGAEPGYACVGCEPAVATIFDCGGNVGLATFYLLHRYPMARVVLFEPDGGNLAVARRTLAPFADRVTFRQAGVWSASVGLVVERGGYRDGTEWAFTVRPARADETPDLDAVTLDQALAESGFAALDLVKIDIEGAEREVFADGPHGWLAAARTVAIETHGDTCAAAVDDALLPRGAVVSTGGELTIYRLPS